MTAQDPVTQPLSAPSTPQPPAGGTQPVGSHPVGSWPGSPFAPALPDHPQAMTVLVLGIISIVAVQLLGPVAWYLGNKALREIDAQPGRWGHRDYVTVGRILGIVSTAILGLLLAMFALLFFLMGTFALLDGA